MTLPLFEAVIEEEHEGLRLDVYLSSVIEDASRSYLQKLVKEGRVSINKSVCLRPSRIMATGDTVEAEIPPPPEINVTPENIPLDILYQDSEVVVVNKPSGLVVHPAPGHYSGTLVNAVMYACPDFLSPGTDSTRPGIVHRLDAFTSGVMIVSKTERAFASLSTQAREHTFDRRYVALVRGEFKEDRGRISASVGRSLSEPGRMSVTGIRGRDAVTHFSMLERFGCASCVALVLETGRTHQIRVHMRFAGHPVLGDPVYGITDFSTWKLQPATRTALEQLNGQALHAELLGFEHPVTGERMEFTAPPPEDFQTALEALRQQ